MKEGDWQERKFFTIDLLEQESGGVAQRFIDFIARDNVSSGQAIKNSEAVYESTKKQNIVKKTLLKAWNKIISDPDDLLVELLSETAEKLCGHAADSILIQKFISRNKGNWILSEVPPPKGKVHPPVKPPRRRRKKLKVIYTGKTISSFSFKNKVYEVRSWREMLMTMCEIFASSHRKEFDNVLSIVGRKRPYFTRNPNELRYGKIISNTNIYVETNVSANEIVKLCFQVLSTFGFDDTDLTIEAG